MQISHNSFQDIAMFTHTLGNSMPRLMVEHGHSLVQSIATVRKYCLQAWSCRFKVYQPDRERTNTPSTDITRLDANFSPFPSLGRGWMMRYQQSEQFGPKTMPHTATTAKENMENRNDKWILCLRCCIVPA